MTARAPDLTSVESELASTRSLLAALDAVKSVRAFAVAFAAVVAALAVVTLLGWLSLQALAFGLGTFGMLVGAVVLFFGFNAAGVLLMEEARGQPLRQVREALAAGAVAGAKLMLVLAAAGALFLVLVAATAFLFFLCKMPFLGPVLFALVGPLSAALLGIFITAGLFLLLPLAAPAVWAGEGVGGALARVALVAQRKLLTAMVLQLLLFLLALAVAGLLSLVLFSGIVSAGALSTTILGVHLGSVSIDALAHDWITRGVRSSHVLAALVGGGVLFAVPWLVLQLILARGWCVIYLDLAAALDFRAGEARLHADLRRLKERAVSTARVLVTSKGRAEEAGVPEEGTSSMAAAERAREDAEDVRCPACGSGVRLGDVFCSNCGVRLR